MGGGSERVGGGEDTVGVLIVGVELGIGSVRDCTAIDLWCIVCWRQPESQGTTNRLAFTILVIWRG
jgi:hypothetical protein